jgi:hypothetical protein
MYIVVFGILSDPEIGISGGPWYYFVIEIARYYLIYVVEQCQELKVEEKRRHLRAKIKEVEEKLNTIFVRHSFLRTKLTPIFNDINNLLDTIILDPVNSNDDESFEEDESCSDKEYYYIYAYKRQYPFEKFVPKILNWILHLLEDIDLNMQKQLSPVQSSSFSSNKSRANAGGAYNAPYIAQQDFDDRREIPLTQTFVISKRYSEASSSKRQSEASSSKRQSEATSSSHESSTQYPSLQIGRVSIRQLHLSIEAVVEGVDIAASISLFMLRPPLLHLLGSSFDAVVLLQILYSTTSFGIIRMQLSKQS